MGNWSDVEYKLDLAQATMNDESIKGKKGYLMMIGTNQCSFRPNGELAEDTEPPIVTDENGLPVTSTTTTTTVAEIPDYGWQNDDVDNGWDDQGQYDGGQGDAGEGWYGDDFGYDGYENGDIYEVQ